MKRLVHLIVIVGLTSQFMGCMKKSEPTATQNNATTATTTESAAPAQSRNDIYLEARDYFDGKNGKPVDKEHATELFHKAAEMGHPDAMFFVGHDYEFGNPPDYEKAIEWYEKSIKAGSGATNEAHVKEVRQKLAKSKKQ